MNGATSEKQFVLIGDTFIYTDNAGSPVSGETTAGNFTSGVSNCFTNGVLAEGEFTVIDPFTRKGIEPSVSVPDEIQFVQYYKPGPNFDGFDALPPIAKGSVIKYSATAYGAFVPMAVALRLNGSPVVDDEVTLTIPRLTYRDLIMQDIVITHRFETTSEATELASIATKINQSIVEQYAGYKPYVAKYESLGGDPTLLLLTTPVTVDYKNVIPNQYPVVDLFLTDSTDNVNNNKDYGWTQLFPSLTKTKGNYTGSTFTNGTWANGGTYNAGSPGSPGTGTQIQAKSHWWSSHLGNRGFMNRVLYPKTPYDPSSVATSYKVYTIHYRPSSVVEDRGGVVSSHKAIQTLYVDSTYTDLADFDAFFTDLMDGLMA